jgi:MFS family permease
MLTGTLISNLGNSIVLLAIPWFVLQTTGSAGKMGLVAAASVAPMVVSTFVGGTLTDRMSHRQLAAFADVLSALSVAAIPALHATTGLNLPALMALVFLGAIFDGPGMNARQAMIPKLAERAGMSLERVNSGFGIGRSLMSLLGAPAAGGLVALLGAADALWVTAATFVVSAAITRLLLPATARPEPSGATMLADMQEGLRYIFGNRLLRSIALTATVLNMVLNPIFTIGLPVYIADMGYDAGALGLLLTSVAAGSLAGSLIYGWLGERLPPRPTVTVTLAMLTLPLFGMAMRPGLVAMWLLLFTIDFGGRVINPLVVSFFPRHAPERMLGRALGTMMSTAMMASPLGMLVGGALIGSQGFAVALLAGGIAMAAVSVPLALNGSRGDLRTPPSVAAETA